MSCRLGLFDRFFDPHYKRDSRYRTNLKNGDDHEYLPRHLSKITRKNLNVQPTIKIPAGYKFNVRVNRDILFEDPYQPVLPLENDVPIGGSKK